MNKAVLSFFLSAAFLFSGRSFAVDGVFDGLWKLNLAKSKLAGQTFTIEKAAAGKMRIDLQGFAYDFDLSGKPFPTPDGATASVVAPDPKTWEFTIKLKERDIGKYHFAVEGDTASLKMTAKKEDGSNVETVTSFERVSGGPGHLGKWRSKEASGVPPSLKITTAGKDQISVDCPEMKMTCAGAFDGKDHVVKLAGEPTKQAFVFERQGPKQFKLTTKVDGKPYMVEVFALSDDGRTLTDNANFVAADEPVTYVFEKH